MSRFSVGNFYLTVPKIFVEEPFCVAENFWYRKMSRREKGASRLFLENLLCHSTEKLRWANMCFRKFLVSKNVKDERERGASRLSIENLLSHSTEKLRRGNLYFRKVLVSQNFLYERGRLGVSQFSVGNFLPHSAEKFCTGTLLCCRKFLVSKNVKEKREREGGITTFPRKFVVSIPKNFVGETCVSKSFWYRKMLRIRERGRGASRLSVENLLSHSTEKLRRGNLCFRTVLVSKNVKDKRERGHHDFPSKICCLTIPKDFVAETCVSEKFWYRKILWMRGEGRECHDFPLEIVCLTVPKIFAEEPFCVAENFWYRKMSRRRERGHHDFPSKFCCLTVPKNFVGQTCV